jgi:multiple sugar transport system substrate-binding protein
VSEGSHEGMTRRTLLGTAAAAAVAIATGCGRETAPIAEVPATRPIAYDGPPVALKIWTGFTGDDGPTMQALIDRFNGEHQNISVAMSVILWNDYYQKVPAAVYSGNGPDMGIMHVAQLPIQAAHGIILPLDEVTAAMGVSQADFSPALWRAGSYHGHRYGIPLDLHPLGFYWNTALLEKAGMDPDEPPRTREAYLQACAAIKRAGIPASWVSPFEFTGSYWAQSLVPQFGGRLFAADGSRATFDSDEAVEAVSFMRQLVTAGYSPANVAQDSDNIAFLNGRNAFMWNGPWAVNQYTATPGLKWGVAELPRIGEHQAAWSGSHHMTIMRQRRRDDDRLAASRVFIDWLSRNSAGWAKAGMVPARRSVRESAAFAKAAPKGDIFAREVDIAQFDPPVAGLTDVRSMTFDVAIQRSVLGKAPVRQALGDAAQQANALIAQNREKFGV